MNKNSMVFWAAFLVVVVIGSLIFWKKYDPLHNDPKLLVPWTQHQISLLKHFSPEVSAPAWRTLHNLYFTKWASYYIILDHINDKEPISFLLESYQTEAKGGGVQRKYRAGYHPMHPGTFKPYFYKGDQPCCRTVGDSLKAIVYNDHKWKIDNAGDFDDWWEQNRKFIKQ